MQRLHVDLVDGGFLGDGPCGRDPRRLARDVAPGHNAHRAVNIVVARNAAPGREQIFKPRRSQRPVRDPVTLALFVTERLVELLAVLRVSLRGRVERVNVDRVRVPSDLVLKNGALAVVFQA